MRGRASWGMLWGVPALLFFFWAPAHGAEVRIGTGVSWGLAPVSFSFVGVAARGQLRVESMSVLLEGTLLRDLRADDWVLYLDGALLLHLENSYLGAGGGWARWEDTAGRDSGVWTQVYLKLLAGQDVTLFALPIYIQVNITLGEWYWLQPAVTVGVWF